MMKGIRTFFGFRNKMLFVQMRCKHLRLLVAIIYLIMLPFKGFATQSCSSIALVSSNSHFTIVHRIEAILFAQSSPQIKLVHLLPDVSPIEILKGPTHPCLIVTIGAEALATVLKADAHLPILSVLTRKNIFQQLLKEANRTIDDPEATISAIYLDQPLSRQLNLIKCMFSPNRRSSLGVMLGAESLQEQEFLQQLAVEKGLNLTTMIVNKLENPVAVLDNLVDEAKVVLAIPDSTIYNPTTSRGILLTAFHKRIPIIGYSRTYVNNGALAAVYSTTKQLAEQTALEILKIINNEELQLPPPQYPKDFAVAVNYQVARSLQIPITSEVSLYNSMSEMEH